MDIETVDVSLLVFKTKNCIFSLHGITNYNCSKKVSFHVHVDIDVCLDIFSPQKGYCQTLGNICMFLILSLSTVICSSALIDNTARILISPL